MHFGSAQSPISAWRIIGSTSQLGCSHEKAPVPGSVDVAFWSQLCTRTKVLLGGSLSAAEGIWVVPTQEINPGVRDMLWLPGYLVIPFHVSTWFYMSCPVPMETCSFKQTIIFQRCQLIGCGLIHTKYCWEMAGCGCGSKILYKTI